MRIRILGAGWYGCHLACALTDAGYTVEVRERADRIFAGASGANPARLHLGPHYPRSAKTRQACRDHASDFSYTYGHLTRGVPINLYAVAADQSLVDFDTYTKVLRGELEFLTVTEPQLYGLENVEGAILVGERHLVIDEARAYFTQRLGHRLTLNAPDDGQSYELQIDCTFCATDSAGVDRFEPCLTVLLEGPTDRAITIMDGPFPSLYPWNEARGLSSLTSASLTPFSKTCRTWHEARGLLDSLSKADVHKQAAAMVDQMAKYYPSVKERYRIVDHLLAVRAQPASGADARLCSVVQTDVRNIRVRAGKIDAVFHAEREVKRILECWPFEAREAA